MCVQDFDARGVVQFTLINTFGSALHRYTNRVIHHTKFSPKDDVSIDLVVFYDQNSRLRKSPLLIVLRPIILADSQVITSNRQH